MKKTVYMFPGQGAQYMGMARDFYDNEEICREVFRDAGEAAELDLEDLVFNNNDRLDKTEYTQIAILTAELAILEVLKAKGLKSDANIGLSLGEYAALVASGVLDAKSACKVVRQRGILMEHTVEAGKGAMSAVLAMDKEAIEETIAKVDGIVGVANYNCPGQIVISGEKNAVAKAGELLATAGAKRVIPLNVSGPFHSPMLKPAGDSLGKVLEEVSINTPTTPYLSNYTADYVTSDSNADTIKDLLCRQVYSPVRFQQSIERLISDGYETFIEIGPGRTLSAFVKKINRNVEIINIEHYDDLGKLGI